MLCGISEGALSCLKAILQQSTTNIARTIGAKNVFESFFFGVSVSSPLLEWNYVH